MEKVTLAIIVRNQERYIEECLESARWADEIIILDGFSTDKTVEICRRFTDRVYRKEFESFNIERNHLLEKAGNDWIFFIDSDMRILPELAGEIKETLRAPECSAYGMRGLTLFMGRQIRHGGWFEPTYLRLFNKKKCYYDTRLKYIDNVVVPDGNIGRFKNYFIHYGYRDMTEYLEKINRYSTLNAFDLKVKGMEIKPYNMCYYFLFKPFIIFLYKYAWKRGFLDGFPGFVIAVFSAFTYLSSYVKLYAAGKNTTGR